MRKIMALILLIVIVIVACIVLFKRNTHTTPKKAPVTATSILKRDLTTLLSHQKTQTQLNRLRHFGIKTITVASLSFGMADYCNVTLNNPDGDVDSTAASDFPDIPYIDSDNCIASFTLRYFKKTADWRVTEFSAWVSEKSIPYPAAHKQLMGEFAALSQKLQDVEMQIQRENKTQATWRIKSHEQTK